MWSFKYSQLPGLAGDLLYLPVWTSLSQVCLWYTGTCSDFFNALSWASHLPLRPAPGLLVPQKSSLSQSPLTQLQYLLLAFEICLA